MLAKLTLVIISKYIYSKPLSYTLNVYSVICRLYLNKTGERRTSTKVKEENIAMWKIMIYTNKYKDSIKCTGRNDAR